MTNYIGIPILVLAAVLDAAVMPEFRLGGGAPDLVFMLVVSWALLADLRQALAWSVIGGVLHDLMSISPLGTSALGLVIVSFAANSIFGEVPRGNVLIPPVVAAAGTIVYHLSIMAVLWGTGRTLLLGQMLFYVTLPTVVFNMILMVPVFRTMGLLRFWLYPHRPRVE